MAPLRRAAERTGPVPLVPTAFVRSTTTQRSCRPLERLRGEASPVVGVTGGRGHFEARTRACVCVEADVGGPGLVDALAELLLTMYCDALGLPLPAAHRQRYGGSAWLDLRRDVHAAVYYRHHGELTVRGRLRRCRSF